MKKFIYLILIPAIAVGSFLAGNLYNHRSGAKDQTAKQPVREEKVAVKESQEDNNSMPPGTVRISSQRQQMIGLRAGIVEKKALTHTIRLHGRVAADETRIYFINATVDGWITESLPNSTGSFVRKNETLARFYSPEFLSAEQALLFALSSKDRVRTTGKETLAQKDQIAQFNINLQQYRDSLINLGMGDLQIEEMIRTRKYTGQVDITSPSDGFILARNVSKGLRFDKGKELYRIADLNRVWILADIYENEAEYLKPGINVKFHLPHQKKTFQGKVSNVLPQFDPATRTLKVRIEADNPGFILRPDMFVDVELPISFPPAIAVPADAVLDSGLKKTVFVERGNGFFEPREVETGWRMGNRVEVVKGLEPGERIVVSGNFLIDSESKLEMAASGMLGTLSKDPVCGLEVAPRKAEKEGRKSIYGGKTYYFDTDECRQKFEKDPGRYSGKAK